MGVSISGGFKSLIQTRISTPAPETATVGGNRFYIIGLSGQIHQYNLTNAFDLSSGVTYVQSHTPANTGGTNIRTLHFKPDGTRMWVGDNNTGSINTPKNIVQYDLSTAWDISTANAGTVTPVAQTIFQGMHFKFDGTVLYVAGNGTQDGIHQYNLNTAWDTSTLPSPQFKNTGAFGTGVPVGVFFNDTGTVVYTNDNGIINITSLSTAYDITSTNTNLPALNHTGNPQGHIFSNDGNTLFGADRGNGVRQYSVSTAFDLTSTVTLTNTLNVSAQETDVFDVAFG
jgi:hypothetical protein